MVLYFAHIFWNCNLFKKREEVHYNKDLNLNMTLFIFGILFGNLPKHNELIVHYVMLVIKDFVPRCK